MDERWITLSELPLKLYLIETSWKLITKLRRLTFTSWNLNDPSGININLMLKNRLKNICYSHWIIVSYWIFLSNEKDCYNSWIKTVKLTIKVRDYLGFFFRKSFKRENIWREDWEWFFCDLENNIQSGAERRQNTFSIIKI